MLVGQHTHCPREGPRCLISSTLEPPQPGASVLYRGPGCSEEGCSYTRWPLFRLQRGGCRAARVAVPWPQLGELRSFWSRFGDELKTRVSGHGTLGYDLGVLCLGFILSLSLGASVKSQFLPFCGQTRTQSNDSLFSP